MSSDSLCSTRSWWPHPVIAYSPRMPSKPFVSDSTRPADIVTPNLPEAAVLLGRGAAIATTAADLEQQAAAFVESGARAALVKGGHLNDDVLTGKRPGPAATAVRFRLSAYQNPEHPRNRVHTEFRNRRERGEIRVTPEKLEFRGPPSTMGTIYIVRLLPARVAAERHPESGHGPVNHLVNQWL